MENDDELMRPGEVAKFFGVDPKTITRWANEGKIPCVVGLGGHRRYKRADVLRLLKERDAA
jgi:excisionase family DNA binding protein